MQRMFLQIVIVALMLPSIDILGGSSFLQEYVNKYPYYLTANDHSSVALVTDRMYFRPGEKVAFLAAVNPPIDPSLGTVGNLYIQLRDMAGKLLSYTRFPVFSGQASGEVPLLADLPDGVYQLVAFTNPGSRVAFDAGQVRPIVVSRETPEQFAEFILDKAFYAPSEVLKARIGSPNANMPKKVSFELQSASRVFAKGDFNPEENQTEGISITLPAMVEEPLFLRFTAHTDHGKVSQNCYIPIVKGSPICEIVAPGGFLVANQDNQLGIIVSDAFGIPLSVPFTVSVSGRELVTKGFSNSNGKSLLTLPIKSSGRITLSFGEAQKYKLEREMPVHEGLGAIYGGVQSGRLMFFVKFPGLQPLETNWVLFRNGTIVYASQMKIKGDQMVTLPAPTGDYGIMDLLIMDDAGKALFSRSVYVPAPDRVKTMFEIVNNQGHNKSVEATLLPSTNQVSSIVGISLGSKYNYTPVAAMGAFNCLNAEDAEVEVFFRNFRVPNTAALMSADTTTKGLHTGYRFRAWIKGQPAGRAKVWVKDIGNLTEKSLIADDKGFLSYSFSENVVQMPLLYFSAFDSTGRKKAQIVFDTPLEARIDSALAANQPEALRRTGLMAARYGLQIDFVFNSLRPVLPDEPSRYNQQVFSSYSSVLEIIRTLKPFEIMDNQIVFPGGRNSFYAQQGALIIIDGVKMGTNIEVLKSVSPSEIKDVFISTDPVDIQKHTALNSQGIIEIYTFLPDRDRVSISGPKQIKPAVKIVATAFPVWPENGKGFRVTIPDDMAQFPDFGRVYQLNSDGTIYYSDIYMDEL